MKKKLVLLNIIIGALFCSLTMNMVHARHPSFYNNKVKANFLNSYIPDKKNVTPKSRYGQILESPKVALPTAQNSACRHYVQALIKRLGELESFLSALPRREKTKFKALVSKKSNGNVTYESITKNIISLLKQIDAKKSYRVALQDSGFTLARNIIVAYVEQIKPLLKQINLPKTPEKSISPSTQKNLAELAELVARDFQSLEAELTNVFEIGKKTLDEIKKWRKQKITAAKQLFTHSYFGRMKRRASSYRQPKGFFPKYQRPRTSQPKRYPSSKESLAPPQRSKNIFWKTSQAPSHHAGKPKSTKKKPDKKTDPSPDNNKKKPIDIVKKFTQRSQPKIEDNDLQRYVNLVNRFSSQVNAAHKKRAVVPNLHFGHATKLKDEIETLASSINKTNPHYKKAYAKYNKALKRYTKLLASQPNPQKTTITPSMPAQKNISRANIALTKNIGSSSSDNNNEVTYTLNITNKSSQVATNITLKDPQPDGVTFSSHTHTAGNVTMSDKNEVLWRLDKLAPGESARLTIDAILDEDADHKTIINVASLTDSSTEADNPVIVHSVMTPSAFVLNKKEEFKFRHEALNAQEELINKRLDQLQQNIRQQDAKKEEYDKILEAQRIEQERKNALLQQKERDLREQLNDQKLERELFLNEQALKEQEQEQLKQSITEEKEKQQQRILAFQEEEALVRRNLERDRQEFLEQQDQLKQKLKIEQAKLEEIGKQKLAEQEESSRKLLEEQERASQQRIIQQKSELLAQQQELESKNTQFALEQKRINKQRSEQEAAYQEQLKRLEDQQREALSDQELKLQELEKQKQEQNRLHEERLKELQAQQAEKARALEEKAQQEARALKQKEQEVLEQMEQERLQIEEKKQQQDREFQERQKQLKKETLEQKLKIQKEQEAARLERENLEQEQKDVKVKLEQEARKFAQKKQAEKEQLEQERLKLSQMQEQQNREYQEKQAELEQEQNAARLEDEKLRQEQERIRAELEQENKNLTLKTEEALQRIKQEQVLFEEFQERKRIELIQEQARLEKEYAQSKKEETRKSLERINTEKEQLKLEEQRATKQRLLQEKQLQTEREQFEQLQQDKALELEEQEAQRKRLYQEKLKNLEQTLEQERLKLAEEQKQAQLEREKAERALKEKQQEIEKENLLKAQKIEQKQQAEQKRLEQQRLELERQSREREESLEKEQLAQEQKALELAQQEKQAQLERKKAELALKEKQQEIEQENLLKAQEIEQKKLIEQERLEQQRLELEKQNRVHQEELAAFELKQAEEKELLAREKKRIEQEQRERKLQLEKEMEERRQQLDEQRETRFKEKEEQLNERISRREQELEELQKKKSSLLEGSYKQKEKELREGIEVQKQELEKLAQEKLQLQERDYQQRLEQLNQREQEAFDEQQRKTKELQAQEKEIKRRQKELEQQSQILKDEQSRLTELDRNIQQKEKTLESANQEERLRIEHELDKEKSELEKQRQSLESQKESLSRQKQQVELEKQTIQEEREQSKLSHKKEIAELSQKIQAQKQEIQEIKQQKIVSQAPKNLDLEIIEQQQQANLSLAIPNVSLNQLLQLADKAPMIVEEIAQKIVIQPPMPLHKEISSALIVPQRQQSPIVMQQASKASNFMTDVIKPILNDVKLASEGDEDALSRLRDRSISREYTRHYYGMSTMFGFNPLFSSPIYMAISPHAMMYNATFKKTLFGLMQFFDRPEQEQLPENLKLDVERGAQEGMQAAAQQIGVRDTQEGRELLQQQEILDFTVAVDVITEQLEFIAQDKALTQDEKINYIYEVYYNAHNQLKGGVATFEDSELAQWVYDENKEKFNQLIRAHNAAYQHMDQMFENLKVPDKSQGWFSSIFSSKPALASPEEFSRLTMPDKKQHWGSLDEKFTTELSGIRDLARQTRISEKAAKKAAKYPPANIELDDNLSNFEHYPQQPPLPRDDLQRQKWELDQLERKFREKQMQEQKQKVRISQPVGEMPQFVGGMPPLILNTDGPQIPQFQVPGYKPPQQHQVPPIDPSMALRRKNLNINKFMTPRNIGTGLRIISGIVTKKPPKF